MYVDTLLTKKCINCNEKLKAPYFIFAICNDCVKEEEQSELVKIVLKEWGKKK